MLSDDDAPDGGFWQQQFLGQWSIRIGGGTDQVQRNVLGERVLGLPGEPRVDKDIPYRQIAGSPAARDWATENGGQKAPLSFPSGAAGRRRTRDGSVKSSATRSR